MHNKILSIRSRCERRKTQNITTRTGSESAYINGRIQKSEPLKKLQEKERLKERKIENVK